MSALTSELNLVVAEDDDDTADYLTLNDGLAGSLRTVDGLFNSTTGHTHNGAHQGGVLQFLDFNVGEDLTVVGASDLQGAIHAHQTLLVDGAATFGSTLTVGGAATLSGSLDVTGTTRLHGAVTLDPTANLTVGQDATVGRDLTVARNAGITGSLTIGGAASAASLTVTNDLTVSGVLRPLRVAINGYDIGTHALSVGGNGIASGFFFQRNNTAARVWDALDFAISTGNQANSAVIRDANGAISDPKIVNDWQLGGASFTFPTVTNNAGLWRYLKARGSDMLLNLTNGDLIFEKTVYTSGQLSIKDGNSFSCLCDGAHWWVI